MTDIYNSDAGVAAYVEMAEGIDGRQQIERLRQLIPQGSRVLELGSGPAVDLAILAEYFDATGSDPSPSFRSYALSELNAKPAKLIDLDARTLEFGSTPDPFKAIYSNKVLHHLTAAEHCQSLLAQHRCLTDDGVVLHTYWHGEGSTEDSGLLFQHYTEESLKAAWSTERTKHLFEIVEVEPFTEMGHHDSLRLVAQVR